ncbi:helix-turn-helix domain-containing protein [Mycolicibacterium houstonense]|uniref:helix-turn-helix domain-containing protein n=1 Tax=Mycolicibacterium houstonense TaxID=146021 RepID=UPI0009FC56AB
MNRAERIAFVVESAARGWTVVQVAEALGCTTRTVENLRKAAGLTNPRPRLTESQIERIAVLSRRGVGCEEIAAAVGCSLGSVWYARRRKGLSDRSAYTLTSEQLARADALLADGASFTEVARTIGTTTSAVCKRFPGRGWSHTECGSYGKFLARMGGVL